MISYFYKISWQKSHSRSWAWRCSWRWFVIVCQPFNQSSVNIQLSLSLSTKNMFWLRHDRSSVIGFVWCLWNKSNRGRTFSSDFNFVKGLRCAISLTCEDVYPTETDCVPEKTNNQQSFFFYDKAILFCTVHLRSVCYSNMSLRLWWIW